MGFFGRNIFGQSKSKLGIDIGTTGIKAVELRREENSFVLETYGTVNVTSEFGKKQGFNVIQETAEIVKALLERSGVTTKKVVASLPNNVVFVTMIEMPRMSEKELRSAIEFEARRYVPMPLEEVTTSWSVLEDPEETEEDKQLKVLLTAVPTTVIENYQKMFKLAGLTPEALEIEALALIRSLLGKKKEGSILIDIGGRNTSLNLIDHGFLRVSRNLNVGGETITSGIAQNLKVSEERAEQFKRDLGLTEGLAEQIPQAMRPTLDRIKSETGQLIKIYESSGSSVKQVVLSGAGSKLPGLVKYFSDLGPEISQGDPLRFISYDKRTEKQLKNKALSLSVAIGLAMRE